MANDLDRALGERVRQLRQERGLSVAECTDRLSAILGKKVTTSRWSKVESAGRSLPIPELIAVAGVLNIPVSDLLVGDGELEDSPWTLTQMSALLALRKPPPAPDAELAAESKVEREAHELDATIAKALGHPYTPFMVRADCLMDFGHDAYTERELRLAERLTELEAYDADEQTIARVRAWCTRAIIDEMRKAAS